MWDYTYIKYMLIQKQGWIFPASTTAEQLPVVEFAVGNKLFTVEKEYLSFGESHCCSQSPLGTAFVPKPESEHATQVMPCPQLLYSTNAAGLLTPTD